MQVSIEELEKDLEHIIHQLPQWEKQRRDEIRQLNRDTAKFSVDQLIDEAKSSFTDILRVAHHIDLVRSDLVENVAIFVMKSEDGDGDAGDLKFGASFDRYEVNVLVTQNTEQPGAPIVEELHPALGNLIGRIEYVSVRGALVTNFRLIKSGCPASGQRGLSVARRAQRPDRAIQLDGA
jgi:hypothetical protein